MTTVYPYSCVSVAYFSNRSREERRGLRVGFTDLTDVTQPEAKRDGKGREGKDSQQNRKKERSKKKGRNK